MQRVRRLVGRGLTAAFPGRVPWYRQGDFVTFREAGFVHAGSPAELLARHNHELAHLRAEILGSKIERSLEVGCGFGRLSPAIAELSGNHIAIDINAAALQLGRSCYSGVRFGAGSVTDLPFVSNAFDLVVSWTVLQHVPPPLVAGAALEIQRVLRPGGALLLCEETRLAGVDLKGARPHTWHRTMEFYDSLFDALCLEHECSIEAIDRIPGLTSPGVVMRFRAP